ncbi:hypothetical protein ACFVJS_25500 [Nocardioides sp. NPDC057772]|uniref:hypothetical protein n=1 Tax=Nocardioides sp. NPDC057772 TaxID=3346245 RepID=UPI00366B911D
MTGEPEARYAQTSDDIAIAYQVLGSGPVTIRTPSLGNVRAVTVHTPAPLLRDVRLCLAGSTHDHGGVRRAVLP